MIGDAVSNMVNDACKVSTLMGPGTDPHLYKPTKESLDLLSDADIIIANGLHLEGRMQDILEKLSRTKTVIFVGETLPEHKLIYADESGNVPDPHIWFDASIWRQAIANLGDQLLEAAPVCTNHDLIADYDQKLEALELWIQAEIAQIPNEQRVLITAHDAFSYFGKAYTVEVIGLQGISTMAEYGIRDVTNLVDQIVDRQIKSVFVESSVSSRSIEAVIAGCRERGFEVLEGGTLYSDALGPVGSGAESYIGMVRHNVTTIKNALQ
jgi:manganese/zinc/iron transport system substrate-binding protein